MNNLLEKQLTGCLALLQWQEEVREALTTEQLSFILVNRTLSILDATSILFWQGTPGEKGKIDRVSGVAQLDKHAPFMVWMKQILSALAAKEGGRYTRSVTPAEVGEPEAKQWSEWLPPFALWSPLISPDGTFVGALWLVRGHAWKESEMAMAEMLAKTFAHAWMALIAKPRRSFWIQQWQKRLFYLLIIFIVAALALLPVQQSVLAPATVVADDPLVITAPLEGVIKNIEVSANAWIGVGEILFQMEQTKIRNLRDVAEMALQVAQEKYSKAQKLSFADPETKATLSVLRSQIKQQLSEVAYAEALLKRTVIRAEKPGIAIFSNPDEWQGRPVVTGERVMMIADPKQTALEIFLPVADAIIMQPGTDIRLFLNSDPFNPRKATLRYSGYEAKITPDGALAYRLTAYFMDSEIPPRIGLKGMAKLLGPQVPLYYYLFRRPLTALRQSSGF